jgi:LysM repeat protein
VTVPINSVITAGFTCGSIPNAGTVVLVQRAGVVTATPSNPNVVPPVTGGIVHIVRRGENLFRISLRYGVTVQAIASANSLTNPSRIFAGQRLIIPTGGTQPPPIPTATPVAGTPTATLRPGVPTLTPTATVVGTRTHTVRAGENLFRIALRYGLTTEELARANGITNPSLIFPNQVLVIPPP